MISRGGSIDLCEGFCVEQVTESYLVFQNDNDNDCVRMCVYVGLCVYVCVCVCLHPGDCCDVLVNANVRTCVLQVRGGM